MAADGLGVNESLRFGRGLNFMKMFATPDSTHADQNAARTGQKHSQNVESKLTSAMPRVQSKSQITLEADSRNSV
jgi:hypothetical protein